MEFDAPIFKRLANNDTAAAPGHQGGMVIPKDLETFFPVLSGVASSAAPTIDRQVTADLLVEGEYLETVQTRYQKQTWGGTRSAERRLTGNLTALRSRAVGGDVLVIERAIDRDDYFRLTLVKQGSPKYGQLEPLLGGRNWGPLEPTQRPLSEADLVVAERQEDAQEATTFRLFDSDAIRRETRQARIARSRVFQKRVVELYEASCAVCGEGLRSPGGRFEVQAAHIVPRHLFGADDARNGLALCLRHHWAFDCGLFGVNPDRKVEVPKRVGGLMENSSLVAYHGAPIQEARKTELHAAQEAFAWHLRHLVYREPPI